MNPILVIAGNTLRQTVRQRLFLNIGIFGIGMVLLAMLVGSITYGFPDRVVRSIGLSGVTIAVDLMALLLGVGLIHEEIDRKTLFVVLTRPVERWQYVFGRGLGLWAALSVALGGFSIIFFVVLAGTLGSPRPSDAIALLSVLPEAAVLGAFGLVLSSFSTPTLSAGIGVGFWIAAATTDDLLRLSSAGDSASLKWLAKAVYYALPSLARFNFREGAVYDFPVAWGEVLPALSYGAFYAIFLLAVASIILSRREMV